MKRLFVLACLAGLIAVSTVQAAMQVALYQDLSHFSYGDAGEFSAVPNAALLAVNPTLAGYSLETADLSAVNPFFQTFCVEKAEYFSPGSGYDVTIGDKVFFNGGQFPAGESITMGTAWLYSQFAAGTLSGYDYTYGDGRMVSAANLQRAIWYLQSEVPTLVNGSVDGTAFYNAAVSACGRTVTGAANGAYGVVILNLWVPGKAGTASAAAQDQLMLVPEPATASIGLLFFLPPVLRKTRACFRKLAL